MRPTDINWSPIRGWLAPAFRWLVCGLPMCVRHFVVVWKPIAWGQFFLFDMAWVDSCSLITHFKCVIIRTQQCLVPKERDRSGGGHMWHIVWSIFGSCHGNQKWKWQWVWVELDTLQGIHFIPRNSMISTSYRGLFGLFECTYTPCAICQCLIYLSGLDLIFGGVHICKCSPR